MPSVLLRALATLAILGGSLTVGSLLTAPPVVAARTPDMIPASINDTCSTDVTLALESWIAAQPSGSLIQTQPSGCYLVSTDPNNTFTLSGLNGDTIEGGGGYTGFYQNSYNNGSCSGDPVQPVLTLQDDRNLKFENFIIAGPAGGPCGGAGNEGDYGLLIGDSTTGSHNLSFQGVSIANTYGDGIAVHPDLGVCNCGLNTNINFDHGQLLNIGYHGITLEGVNGFTFDGNSVSQVGNFMDMEVDQDCTYTNGQNGCEGLNNRPVGIAQLNVSVTNNTFTNGKGGNWIESEQAACIPQGNLNFSFNKLDSTVPMDLLLGGSETTSYGTNYGCPVDHNVTIAFNSSTGTSGSPCGGSVVSPPNSASIEITDYSNVIIAANSWNLNDGNPTYYPNTLNTGCIQLGDVYLATVEDNTCNNGYGTDIIDGWLMWPWDGYATAYVKDCGNTWGLTEPVMPQDGSPPTTARATEGQRPVRDRCPGARRQADT